MNQCEEDSRKDSETSVQLLDGLRETSKYNIKKWLFICSFAFMMNYSAYGGLVFLQSSLNVEDGLGTAGLFAIYATSALSTIFFVPFLIDFMGAKAAIVAGEIGISIFTIANYYPRWYTIIPAAVFHGFTESAPWAGSAVYITYLGDQYWSCKSKSSSDSKSKSKKESDVYRFFSVFFTFVYLSQVVGNALVCLVLSGLKEMSISTVPTIGNVTVFTNINSTIAPQDTSTLNPGDSWLQCGAQECQSEYIYDENSDKLDKYEPNQMSVYLLLSVFLIMQLIFTSVHAFAMPKIPTKFQESREEGKSKESEGETDVFVLSSRRRVSRARIAIKSELKETLRHFLSPLHLFVFPVIFYNGAFLAFNVTEFTRAYVSCTIGVEQVGMVVMVYGATSMFMSALSTKVLPLLGRNLVFVIVVFMHVTAYLLCLLWQPTADTTWVIYLIAATLGACDGAVTTALQGMFAIYFEDRLGIAFSVKNFASNLGIVAATGISTSLCVYVKIYLLLALLAVAILSYIGAETLYRRSQKKVTQNAEKDAR